MKVLLSIKPEFVEKIFNGTKLFEFRRKIFKRRDIETILIYQTAPMSRVVGEFTIGRVFTGEPEDLRLLKNIGIDDVRFFGYFQGVMKGYAIRIDNPIRYDKPIPLSVYGIKRPPQNFMYLNG